MQRFFQYTLDLFGPPAHVDSVQGATEVVAAIAPGVPHSLARTLRQSIAPATFSHPRANRAVHLDNAVVSYLFQRAKRRSIGFVVGPDGLVVRAPRWTPVAEVEAALREKAQWITRKLDESRQRQTRQHEARITWCDGVVLPLLGEPMRVQLDPDHAFGAVGAQLDGKEESAQGDGNGPLRTLRVGLPKAATPEQIRDAVQAWLMRHAREHFQQRLDHFAVLLGVQWRKLGLSSAGTRWGSARVDGSIRLNWRLIHMRPAVIDYVVAHELSHLRVMDHSPRFWETVSSVVPDYASLRGQLKDDAVPRW
jgi:predicted metal-dependent hydrolase